MYQPQLIEVDPQRIKFSALNPRKHGGDEFARLKQSIQEIGIVQMPLVRILPGGFYEVIDGEGRVRSAQELHLPKIMVISLGHVDDDESLTMLVASNTVREFGFMAYCKGLAHLNRQGLSTEKIAKQLGVLKSGELIRSMSVGYFPDQIQDLILNGIRSSDEGAVTWSQHMIYDLLPLRQMLPGKDPNNNGTLEGVYDYSEVQRAIEQVIAGKISTPTEMRAYVANRKLEMFQQRFDQELQAKLQEEIDQAKQALEEAATQQLQDVKEETENRYKAQVAILQAQMEETENRYKKVVSEVAKRPDEKEIIARRESELRDQMERTELERQRLKNLQSQMQEEANRTKQQVLSELRQKIDADLSEQRKSLQQQYKNTENDLKEYYEQKDKERQLKAEKSVREMSAHGVELLSQTQQWILHITSPGMVNGMGWLEQAEIVTLLAQMRAVRDILEKAEETLRHGEDVPQARTVIDETSSERGLAYHGQY